MGRGGFGARKAKKQNSAGGHGWKKRLGKKNPFSRNVVVHWGRGRRVEKKKPTRIESHQRRNVKKDLPATNARISGPGERGGPRSEGHVRTAAEVKPGGGKKAAGLRTKRQRRGHIRVAI